MMWDVNIDIMTEDLNPVQKITAKEPHGTSQWFDKKENKQIRVFSRIDLKIKYIQFEPVSLNLISIVG